MDRGKCSPLTDVGGDLHNMKFTQRKMLQYMEIQQGYSYHIKDEFFDHIHTVENKPVTVHNELNRILTENLGEVLAWNRN